MKSSIKCLNKAFFPALFTVLILAAPSVASAQPSGVNNNSNVVGLNGNNSSSVGFNTTPTEGCAPEVWDAMKAKADAKVAYDVAVTEQIIKKPDSVLAMTCFNKTAGAAAKNGGATFSGDFSNAVGLVIPDALHASYDDFKGSAGLTMNIPGYGNVPLQVKSYNMPQINVPNFIDNVLQGLGLSQATVSTVKSFASIADSYFDTDIDIGNGTTFNFGQGGVDLAGVGSFSVNNDGQLTIDGSSGGGTSAKPSVEYGEKGVMIPDEVDQECDGVSKLWERVQTEGVQSGMPPMTFQDMLAAGDGGIDANNPPEGVVPNSVMAQNLESSNHVFENLNEKVEALPEVNVPPFSDTDSVCGVLEDAGVVTAGSCE